MPRGSGASAYRAAGASAGLVGVAVAPLVKKAAERGRKTPPGEVVFETPRFGGYGLLALTEQDVVLARGPRNRVHEVIGRMPRSEIVFAEQLGHAFPATAPLVIVFKNGKGWQFEVQWNRWRASKKILSLLQGAERAA
jgi:hypothetical protein